MIEKLSRLKKWQIIALGVAAVVVALVAMGFLAQLCYALFPAAWGWVAVGHVAVSGTAAWFISGVFVDAYILKGYIAEAEAYMGFLTALLGDDQEDEVEAQHG